jgi:cytoplasmic tRNA 2-thiolation protein 2
LTHTSEHTDSDKHHRDCFTKFIAGKCIKQIGLLGKETRHPQSTTGGPPPTTRRYLLGLSLGVSSTVLLHLLNENIEFQLAKGRNAPFELSVVHICNAMLYERQTISSPTQQALSRLAQRYPRFEFQCIPLSAALADVDLASLPLPPGTTTNTSKSIQTLLTTLPTAASREDILRLLTRQALVSLARTQHCQALLLGHSTTALAELTLAETAKGRGYALPWLINDGPAPSPSPSQVSEDKDKDKDKDKGLLIYHPLRDALRKELVTYAGLTDPPLTELVVSGGAEGQQDGAAAAAAVVSHRDLTIEEVMGRYFADVEENYPSVVANVARTTGKLVRAGAGDEAGRGGERCGLCGMPLDEVGDERWRGELGLGTGRTTVEGQGRLCYGCERSTAG